MITFTENEIKIVQQEWSKISNEQITIELINNTFYGYCTELASLRLLKAYRNSDKADCGFSQNLNTFYFRLETDL